MKAVLLAATFAAGLTLPTSSLANPPPVPLAQRSLDLLVLRDGTALRGVLVTPADSGAQQIVVERAWMRQIDPARYEQLARDELDRARSALRELEQRIAEWKLRRPDAHNFTAFLSLEERRIAGMLDDLVENAPPPGAQLLWLTFPPQDVKRVHRQPPRRRQIGLLAWRERLEHVTARSAADLERELRSRDVLIGNEPVDLSDHLLPLPQSDREWAARVAIIEHHFVRRFELQGTGSLLVSTGEKQRPVLSQLISELYRSEISKLLDEAGLAQPGQTADVWVSKATAIADQKEVGGVRVTRLDPDLAGQRVAVESRFLAQMPTGEWETIWRHSETADAARARPQAIERIRKDSQVRGALETLQAVGIAAEDSLELALRFGAATMEAQETVDSRFQWFQEIYLRRLDGPPLAWPADSP